MSDEQTRDRVRAMVREVLDNALPAEEESVASSSSSSVAEPPARAASSVPTRFINTAPEKPVSSEPPIARDESSKVIITEDDVRGLASGARLRIAEGARLTPLAADIVREKKIELVRRASRRGSRESKLVAVGADHGGYRMKEELKNFLHLMDFLKMRQLKS